MLGRRASRLAPPRRIACEGAPTAVRGLASRALAVSHCALPLPCAPLVSRCGRARCPHRAAAPSARCAAWHRAHAESFACRGSVRGTVRGRAAHPARCHNRAAIYPRALRTPLPERRDGCPWGLPTRPSALPTPWGLPTCPWRFATPSALPICPSALPICPWGLPTCPWGLPTCPWRFATPWGLPTRAALNSSANRRRIPSASPATREYPRHGTSSSPPSHTTPQLHQPPDR